MSQNGVDRVMLCADLNNPTEPGKNRMNQEKFFQIVLFLSLIVSAYFFFTRPVWIEPDSTAFYNRACLNGKDFETPILSKKVFDLLPCNETIWKIFHALIIFAGISAIYYFAKKNLVEKEWFWFAFLSYFLLGFLLNIEDDQIAFPLIIVASARLLNNPTKQKKIGYAILTILLTLLVWKGSIIPMGIILAYTIQPILGILAPIAWLIYHYLISGQIGFGDPGNTSETTLGQGFATNDIPLLLLFLAKDKKKKILENKKLFSLFTGFNILSFIYPKLAYYSTIPLILIAEKFFNEEQKNWLVPAGIIALFLAPTIILSIEEPTQQSWSVIQEAVELQKSGEPVYNAWWVGRWFHYKGGKPTQEGGYAGEQNPIEQEFYWLGTKRETSEKEECETIKSAGRLLLQKCFQKPLLI